MLHMALHLSWVVFAVSCLGLLGVFFGYPIILWGLGWRRRDIRPPAASPAAAFVSVVVVVRNAERWIESKVRNALDLDYPPESFEVVVYSDGSEDRTAALVRAMGNPRVRLLEGEQHLGKTHGMNAALQVCRGEWVLFSDGDAQLERNVLGLLVRHFADPAVGGVCGQREVRRDQGEMREAQRRYIRWDSAIKRLESRFGRLTSNDGKLYLIRRHLFRPLPEAVTDDLYVSLTVIGLGYRFLFEPEAIARVPTPSRDRHHEVERRRRIVSTSLRGLFLHRALMNPFRYGLFAVGLVINKVGRRLVGLFMIGLLISTLVPAVEQAWARTLLLLQAGFYGLALSYPWWPSGTALRRWRKLGEAACYFCLGQWGALLGGADFLSGRQIARWNPRKSNP